MSVLLNGSDRYLTLGNAVSVVGARPITLAALIDTATLRSTGSWNSIFSQGDYADRGWGVEIESDNSFRVFSTYATTLGNDENFSSWSLAVNSGWWLIMWTVRDTGAGSASHFYGYRYNTRASFFGTTGGGGATDLDPIAPGASDPTVIGAFNDAGIVDFYPGSLGWLGIWNYDFSNGGSAGSPYFHRLVNEGGWAFQNRLYKPALFVPFSASNNLHDLSPMRRPISAAAGLTWQGSILTEARPRIFNVEWLVPQQQAETYDKSVTFASPVIMAATDSVQFAELSGNFSPVQLAAVETLSVSEDAALFSPVQLAASDSLQITEVTTLQAPVILAASDSLQASTTSTLLSPVQLAATDTAQFTEATSLFSPVILASADSVSFTETTQLISPVILAASSTQTETYDKAVSFFAPVILEAVESVRFTETTTLQSPVTLAAADSVQLTQSTAVYSPATLAATDSVSYTLIPAMIAPAILDAAVSLSVTETFGLFSPVVMTVTAQSGASAGGGSTQWVPLGYDDVLYNQELQKAAERDKLAARLKREKRDEQDLIDILLIL